MHNKKNNTNKTENFIQGLRPLSSSIPHGFKGILKKNGYNFSSVVDNWTKMVGKEISNICYPQNIKISRDVKNGLLILNVLHGKELEIEYKKKEIIEKINVFFGYDYIKEIKLRIIQERKKINSKIKDVNSKKFNNELKIINNDSLKNSLKKLINAYNEKFYK
tara:strand:- start:659 stop:1147 length:489 start_codon:yes stop_codon:yes gene_type:complete